MSIDLVVCFSTELEGALLRERLSGYADTIALVRTGVGVVNAAHALTLTLARQPANVVVVCGVGGAYPGASLEIGDVACAQSECYGDLGATSDQGFLDMEALGFPVIDGAPPIYNVLPLQIFPAARRARFVTLSTCTGTDEAARALVARTGGGVESMEGAAIAHVAHLHGVPVGEIRGISNRVGRRDKATWRLREAATAAQEALLAWIAARES
jgi:futalosine hydrolase